MPADCLHYVVIAAHAHIMAGPADVMHHRYRDLLLIHAAYEILLRAQPGVGIAVREAEAAVRCAKLLASLDHVRSEYMCVGIDYHQKNYRLAGRR